MQYVRIALMTPRRGQSHEATRLLSQIIAFCSQQPGFLGGLIIGGRPDAGTRVGRITLWADEESANRTAREDHMLALRSQLNALVDADRHTEYALDAVALSGEPGGPVGISPGETIFIAEGLVRGQQRVV